MMDSSLDGGVTWRSRSEVGLGQERDEDADLSDR